MLCYVVICVVCILKDPKEDNHFSVYVPVMDRLIVFSGTFVVGAAVVTSVKKQNALTVVYFKLSPLCVIVMG